MDPIVHQIQPPPLWNWAVGIIALAIVAVGARMQTLASSIKMGLQRQTELIAGIAEIKTMHDHPDDYGFGTRQTNLKLERLLKALTEAAEENRRIGDQLYRLTHYLQFDIKSRTGKEPPPPPPNGRR